MLFSSKSNPDKEPSLQKPSYDLKNESQAKILFPLSSDSSPFSSQSSTGAPRTHIARVTITNRSSQRGGSKLTTNLFTDPDKVTNQHCHLYNRCSGGYVQLLGKRVDAQGKKDSRYAALSIQTQPFGGKDEIPGFAVRILGDISGVFLCFNRKGRLVTRWNGNNIRCTFSEVVTDNKRLKLQSLFNPEWFIGFNSRGQKLTNSIDKSGELFNMQKCHQFIKD